MRSAAPATAVIVVATDDFEVYHGAVTELRDRGVAFTTVEPGAGLPECDVVVTGPDDDLDVVLSGGGAAGDAADSDVAEDGSAPGEGSAPQVVRASPGDPRKAVDEALAALRGAGGRTVVGVDPGDRPGVAVLVGGTVVAAFHVPLADAASVVLDEVEGAPDPLVRVGDGARLQGARVIDDLEGVTVELVDETGTTPFLGTGARGMGDVLAAVNIARIAGEVVDSRDIEPTEGEIQVIKDRSRERSDDNRTISEVLARRVAAGELTVEEALDEHRDASGSADGGEGDGRDGDES